MPEDTTPALRLLSLGAGVQSTTLLLLAAEGRLPGLDGAIFADTGSEPAGVYEHLDRLEEQVAKPAGIPIYRVSYGNLRDDLLDPNRMAMIPAYTLGPARTVRVVASWRMCTCEWAWFRTGGVRVDFDDFALFDDEATVDDLLAIVRGPRPTGSGPGGGDEEAVWVFRHQVAGRLVSALNAVGLDRVPAPHGECKSLGRVATAWRDEVLQDKGMLGRKCTQTYKLRPLLEQVRLLLGASASESPCRHCEATGNRLAPWRAKRGEDVTGPCSVCHGTGTIHRVGQPPAGVWAEQWIGFSTDEVTRVSDRGDTRYSRSRYPLLELDMSREQCIAYLAHHGWGSVAKSACTFCPYHGNREWRNMRDNDPGSWKEATEFDQAYRTGAGMNSQRYLHISVKPLAEAPIDVIRRADFDQLDLLDSDFAQRLEEGDPDGCSPWGCRSGDPVTTTPDDTAAAAEVPATTAQTPNPSERN